MLSNQVLCRMWQVAVHTYFVFPFPCALTSECRGFFSGQDVDLIDENAEDHLSLKFHPKIGQQSLVGVTRAVGMRVSLASNLIKLPTPNSDI